MWAANFFKVHLWQNYAFSAHRYRKLPWAPTWFLALSLDQIDTFPVLWLCRQFVAETNPFYWLFLLWMTVFSYKCWFPVAEHTSHYKSFLCTRLSYVKFSSVGWEADRWCDFHRFCMTWNLCGQVITMIGKKHSCLCSESIMFFNDPLNYKKNITRQTKWKWLICTEIHIHWRKWLRVVKQNSWVMAALFDTNSFVVGSRPSAVAVDIHYWHFLTRVSQLCNAFAVS